MQPHIKQKLTGAAIVVVFLVIAIPFLLAGSMRQQKQVGKPVDKLVTNVVTATRTVPISQLNSNKAPSSNPRLAIISGTVNPAAASTPVAPALVTAQNGSNSASSNTANSTFSVTPVAAKIENNDALPKNIIASAEAANAPAVSPAKPVPVVVAAPQLQTPKSILERPETTNTALNSMHMTPSNNINRVSANANFSNNPSPALHSSVLQKEANIVGNTAHKLALHSKKKQRQYMARNHHKKKITGSSKEEKEFVDTNKVKSKEAMATNTAKSKSAKKSTANKLPKTWVVEMGGYASLKEAQNVLYMLPRTYPIVIEKYSVPLKDSKKTSTQASKSDSRSGYRVVIKNITSENEAQKIAAQVKKLGSTAKQKG